MINTVIRPCNNNSVVVTDSTKPFRKFLLIILAILASTTCSLASALDLRPSRPPFDLGATRAHFIKDIQYGPEGSSKLDIFLPEVSRSRPRNTPLVVFFHGGGFTSGSKEDAYRPQNREDIITLLNNGVAYAAVSYPLVDDRNNQGLLKSLNGSKRALQFLRYHRGTFNIAPDRIVLIGSSAGASTALWLALHDDMANLNSRDPVERQSTRARAAAAIETQSSMDIVRWEEVFKQYHFSVTNITDAAKQLYAIDGMRDLFSPRITGYRQMIDMLNLMDRYDPEIWVANENVPVTSPDSLGILYHHPYHAKALRDQATRVGLRGSFYIPRMNLMPIHRETMTEFILRKVR